MKYRQDYIRGLPAIVFSTVSLRNKTHVDLDKPAFSWGSENIYVVDRRGVVLHNTQMNVLIAAVDTGKYYRVPISAFKEAPEGSVR